MGEDTIAPTLAVNEENDRIEKTRMRTLGNVRLRHIDTNEIILIPTPSNDPNDPLNWSQWYKYYIATVICLAMMMCNFLAAGPSIALVQTAMEFFPGAIPQLNPGLFTFAVSQVAYYFTACALMQGVGNFIWVPVANKFGRRPTYILSYAIYTATAIWLCFDKTYNGFLAGRILLGFGAGAAETIAPITIADVFFLHERGTMMALYTCFLSIGVALGLIICGLITIAHDWRVIYEVAAALIGFVLLLAFFTFPETAYVREPVLEEEYDTVQHVRPDATKNAVALDEERHVSPARRGIPKKQSYLSSLKIFHRTLTNESLFKLIIRPLGLICLPPVLWAALVESVTIGFLVALSSNFNVAFLQTYGFQSWQLGLCFIAGIIGSLIGIPAGGLLGDKVADYFTKRNGGIRDPEMRLPAIIPTLITAPLGLVLYGVGIEHQLHWICPTIGLGLVNFSIVQSNNIALVYVIDAYRPVAGEITLSVMGFKSLFGFLLSFYTNQWVAESGYQNAFGTMGAIAAIVVLGWVPLYIWGKKIRHVTWSWPVVSYVHWSDDREVGE